ncbi:hypothetical protein V6Z12_D05G336600 [Gossypium hirsutum]
MLLMAYFKISFRKMVEGKRSSVKTMLYTYTKGTKEIQFFSLMKLSYLFWVLFMFLLLSLRVGAWAVEQGDGEKKNDDLSASLNSVVTVRRRTKRGISNEA